MNNVRAVPSKIDFEMVSGDSKTLRVEIVSRNLEPYELGGVTAIRWALAKGRGAEPVLEKTLAGDEAEIVQMGEKWYVSIPLAPDDTSGLRGTFFHECELTEGTIVSTAWQGDFTIRPDGVT